MQSAQIAWPPQATIVQALQTPDAYYASGPKIITVTDRQVYIDSEENPGSLYSSCRAWVQNDPDVDPAQYPPVPDVARAKLPPVPPPSDEPVPEPAGYEAKFPNDYENYDPANGLRRLKEHWVQVRSHHVEQRFKRAERYKERLEALLPEPVTKPAQ